MEEVPKWRRRSGERGRYNGGGVWRERERERESAARRPIEERWLQSPQTECSRRMDSAPRTAPAGWTDSPSARTPFQWRTTTPSSFSSARFPETWRKKTWSPCLRNSERYTNSLYWKTGLRGCIKVGYFSFSFTRVEKFRREKGRSREIEWGSGTTVRFQGTESVKSVISQMFWDKVGPPPPTPLALPPSSTHTHARQRTRCLWGGVRGEARGRWTARERGVNCCLVHVKPPAENAFVCLHRLSCWRGRDRPGSSYSRSCSNVLTCPQTHTNKLQ